MKKIIFLLFLAIGANSCSKKIDQSSVANTKWVLIQWPSRNLPSSAKATLNFSADPKIGGKSFCNSYGGDVTILNGAVKFDKIFSTKMFCEGVNEAEINYHADLLLVNQIKLNDDRLSLLKNQQTIMVFEKVQ